LVAVREPLATALNLGPPAPAPEVAAALAQSLRPLEASDPAPPWLWSEQVPSFQRALHALRSYGGTLLADPVGSGKTYIGLAVGAALNGRHPTPCLVPAPLVPQWERVAHRLGVSVIVWSHERLSRGRLPQARGRFIVIDESHHFRNPATRRYSHLAPWLVGRRALLVTASPVVNRLADLQHQLALTVRDDALARHGVPSLTVLLERGRGHTALGHIIIARPAAAARRPARCERRVPLDDATLLPLREILAGVDRMKLSTKRPIAALVRAAFWRAAASSPAALTASLDRYRRLLEHAADAVRAGHALDRRLAYAVTNQLDDQLLLWELLPLEPSESELVLDDLPTLHRLRAASQLATQAPDPKLAQLRSVLADGRCSVVFTAARETVRYLRDRLTDGPIAWCTGERAGIGSRSAPRQTVLDWFHPLAVGRSSESILGLIPRVLIATDVAAEGLDLHRAERVVHYDLPWTPARLDQREGRACRAGAHHDHMEGVQFDPPPAVEQRLRQLACLIGKRGLPSAVGLDDSGRGLWRWRVDLGERFRDRPASLGVAQVRAAPAGILAGFALHPWTAGSSEPLASWVLWWDRRRGWTEDPDVIVDQLAIAARAVGDDRESLPLPRRTIDQAIGRLAGPIRERMRQLTRSQWLDRPLSSTARTVVTRLQTLGRAATRRRNGAALCRLEAALRFAAGGHTAGERALIARLASAPDSVFEQMIEWLPTAVAPVDAVHCRLTGLIVFAP
jgi:superfamily II DNA or RNA helicase